MTDRYAVVGNPIAHSKSPRIHTLFAAQTGQDLIYEAIAAPLDGFRATLEAFRAAGGRGINVTVPFKEAAFHFATRSSARAQAAGAVNTLVFSDDQIFGDNTDGVGLVRDLTSRLGCTLVDKRILLLGAGGAARGVLLPLLEEKPQQLVIANRTAEKARHLVNNLSAQVIDDHSLVNIRHNILSGCGLDELPHDSGFDLIINATAAGLSNSTLALPPQLFAAGTLAYDMVYGKETPFMHLARGQGASVADGLGMLIEQAAESFLLWRGIRPDTATVMATLRCELQQP